MQPNDHLILLERSYEAFRHSILTIPDHLFLTLFNGWSPRDVVAHLIGWNDHMITASQSILRGETPSYYADFTNDYKNTNAEFVARYASPDKAVGS